MAAQVLYTLQANHKTMAHHYPIFRLSIGLKKIEIPEFFRILDYSIFLKKQHFPKIEYPNRIANSYWKNYVCHFGRIQ